VPRLGAISPPDTHEQGDLAMMGLALMRSTLSAIGVLFGGLGMFFLYYSFAQPMMAVYALMFLGTASAIAWSTPK
jgi:hypothetical protein